MMKILRLLGHALRCVLLLSLVLLLLIIVSLCVYDQRLPQSWTDSLATRLSTADYLVRIDSLSFRLTHGLRLHGVRVLAKRTTTTKPVLSAKLVDVDLALHRLPWSLSTIVRRVTIQDLVYPRLPDSYYIPNHIRHTGQPDYQERNEPLVLALPNVSPFRLVLVRPNILGIAPARATAGSVSLSAEGLFVDDVDIEWPDTDAHMTITGSAAIDLEKQVVHGDVKGQARQRHIRPLLVALDIPISLVYMDAFTNVERPIDAACHFDVNLRNNDFHLFLDLAPTGGAYNGVPLAAAHGNLEIRVAVRGTNQNARVTVGPIQARAADETTVAGSVIYESTNNIAHLYFDAQSGLWLTNALAIADILNDGTLDCLKPDTPVALTVNGRLAVDPARAATDNDLGGAVSFPRGRLFGIPLRDASAAYHLRGTAVTFSDIHAVPQSGGSVGGTATISFPGFDASRAAFAVDIQGQDIQLADLADVFGLDAGIRHGVIDGALRMTAPLSTNLVAHLNGEGSLRCRDGYLSQMNLFAGFTDYLSAHVPGIAALVNQSQGSLDFTITNGVFYSDNLSVEGDVFSIHGHGHYDMNNDKLDMIVRAQLFKNDSFAAKLARPITWPFTKLLLEFHVFGSIRKPDWTYISPIDHLTGGTTIEKIQARPVETLVVKPVDKFVVRPMDDYVVKPVNAVVVRPVDNYVIKPAATVITNPVDTLIVRPFQAIRSGISNGLDHVEGR